MRGTIYQCTEQEAMNDHECRKEEKQMEKQQYIDRAEHALYKVYNRFPVVFDHGEGVKLYDTDGQEYLDFGAGIAVMGLGYSCDEV